MSTKNFSTHTKKYKRVLSAVHMVYRLVNATFNVRELSLRLTRLLCRFLPAQSASIYILDHKKKKIAFIAIFDGQINIYKFKRKELSQVTSEEKNIALGKTVVQSHLLTLPLVADDNIGAIVVHRLSSDEPFSAFDRELLTVFAEQAVTAIKNLQLYEQQQKMILGSMKFIRNLLDKQSHLTSKHTPVYFKIVKALAEKLSMGQEGIESLYYASVLHDAGSIDVPFDILSKTSQLTPEEFKVIHKHPAKSVELIKPVEFLKPVLPIILYHHEKYDGTGYPSGLKKEEIPLGARVMAIVDAFEAMILGRPYRGNLSIDEAVEEIKRNSGTQFDPRIVNIFCDLACQKKFRKYLSVMNR